MDNEICEKSKVPCLSSFIVYGALKEDLNLKFKKNTTRCTVPLIFIPQ